MVKAVTGRTIEQRLDGNYILRTPSGVMCLGKKMALAERPPVIFESNAVEQAEERAVEKQSSTPSKAHRVHLTEDEIQYFVDQHNNHGKNWLELSFEAPCSDTVLRRICLEWCEENDPEAYKKLKQSSRYVKVDHAQVCDDYASGDMTIRAIAQKYGVGESRIYKILQKEGWVI